ncbi:MAG: YceI family protein [Usitatibacter sp.]
MKRLTLVTFLVALLGAQSAAAELETYTVDPAHTRPTYEVSHFGYSMQRGRFNKTSGKITLDIAAKKGSADIVVDTASVDSGVPKLDEHLRSEDFFNAARNPQITFKSNSFAFEGDRVKSATGDLTMNGVTRPVTLTATVFQCAPHPMNKRKQCGADLITTVKRSDFGMKYGLPVLGDDVTLRIPVESVKD